MIDLTKPLPQRDFSPPKVLIYGTPGVGKSTFAARSKNIDRVFFCDLENGHSAVRQELGEKYNGMYISNLDEFHVILDAMLMQNHKYKYLVIDTVDWLETRVHEKVCKKYGARSIYDGSNQMTNYNKGPGLAKAEFDDILKKLDLLIEQKKMCVILLAHAQINKTEELDGNSQKIYSMKTMDKLTNKLFTEWPDIIAFSTKPTAISATGAKIEGEPLLFFKSTVAVVKARTLQPMPETIPLDINLFWDEYKKANSKINLEGN